MAYYLFNSLDVLLWGFTCRVLLITRLSPQVDLTQRRTWLPLAQGVPKAARRKPNPSFRPWEGARGRIPYGRDGGRRRETRQRQGTQGGLPRRSEVAVATRRQVPPRRAAGWSEAIQQQLPALPVSYANYPHVFHPRLPGSGMPLRTQNQALAPLYYGRLQVRRRGAPRATPTPRLPCYSQCRLPALSLGCADPEFCNATGVNLFTSMGLCGFPGGARVEDAGILTCPPRLFPLSFFWQ